jgi:transcription elongation GreA/GreB family factor
MGRRAVVVERVAMDTSNPDRSRLRGLIGHAPPSRGVPPPLLTRQERDEYVAELNRLRELLATARVIDGDVAPHVVTLGRSVEVEYLSTGRVATYRIAGVPGSAGSESVSAGSPIGAALMGRSPGDVVAVELPRGRTEDLRILSVLGQEQAA